MRMSGESTGLPSMSPGFICGLCLLLVLHFAPKVCHRLSGFPPSNNPTISDFQLAQDRRPAWNPAEAEILYFFVYSFFYLHTQQSC